MPNQGWIRVSLTKLIAIENGGENLTNLLSLAWLMIFMLLKNIKLVATQTTVVV